MKQDNCEKRSLFGTLTGIRSLRLMFLVLLVAILAAGGSSYSQGTGAEKRVTVLTRNVDEGTDLDFILAAASSGTIDDLLAAVAQTYEEVAASNIPERASALAREIQETQPDLVGLQEVSIWRTGPVFDPKPARKVAFDPLKSLLAELERLGLQYEPAAIVTDFDFELPSALGIDIRRTDRDVLLVRTNSGVTLSNVQAHNFDTRLPLDSPLLGQIEVPAGWISADVKIRGQEFRVVTTHLDNLSPDVRLGQAFELSQGATNTELPVVLMGDFNSDAESSDPDQNGAYQLLLGAGLRDAWAEAHPGVQGFTWPLHDEDPFVPFTSASQRIDFVLFRGLNELPSAELIGNHLSDLTPSGLWPSDHAGLLVTFRLR
jgi:endonuclease/exonuclease/phosphatase family metal-dependent hydrolase